ncbi:MAG TPA: SDR family oxidoreductase [Fimbriimonas sp.]|nr:SDR family oxidoreductase [Fimbriimonas sp.]
MNFKTAIVVGASSGIGRELVRKLAKAGVKTAAIARRIDRLNELAEEFPGMVIPVQHDVANFDEVPELFMKITEQIGGLDMFIYNAGVMPEVDPSEFNFEKDKQMIDVNISGAVAWCNAAADRFQHTKHGSLIGIGSVAGDRGRQGQPVYNASKAFLHTYFEALRNRLSRHGVTVVTIKPGPTATEMTAHMQATMMPADVAARIILSKANNNGEHYLKPVHRLIFYIIKRIPSPVFRKLKI